MSKSGRKELKQENRRHFKRITVCYNKQEFELLEKKLKDYSGSASELVREMSLQKGRLPKAARPVMEESLLKELNRVGVGLNQISKSVNGEGGAANHEGDMHMKLEEAIKVLLEIQMRI